MHDILIICIDLECALDFSGCWGTKEGKNYVFLDSGKTWVILVLPNDDTATMKQNYWHVLPGLS